MTEAVIDGTRIKRRWDRIPDVKRELMKAEGGLLLPHNVSRGYRRSVTLRDPSGKKVERKYVDEQLYDFIAAYIAGTGRTTPLDQKSLSAVILPTFMIESETIEKSRADYFMLGLLSRLSTLPSELNRALHQWLIEMDYIHAYMTDHYDILNQEADLDKKHLNFVTGYLVASGVTDAAFPDPDRREWLLDLIAEANAKADPTTSSVGAFLHRFFELAVTPSKGDIAMTTLQEFEDRLTQLTLTPVAEDLDALVTWLKQDGLATLKPFLLAYLDEVDRPL
ncbi:Hypothetical protein POVN_LOCUS216 [uncultured virus]|nr:Hypothetical protein POVN_LOCUS216 [uncultured virus]